MAVASAVVVGVSAAPAYAVDGVVLINQNTATSGGLPGCPTGGNFPIKICQSGSYRLSGDLTITGNTDAIDINSDNVTLDLNGFSISCPAANCGSAVYSNQHFDVTVKNGSMSRFQYGLQLTGSGSLSDIKSSNNSTCGIYVDGFTVLRSSAFLNLGVGGVPGELPFSCGIDAHNSTVTDSIANQNQIGFIVHNSALSNNVSNSNSNFGIINAGGLVGNNVVMGTLIGQDILGPSQGTNYCSSGPC